MTASLLDRRHAAEIAFEFAGTALLTVIGLGATMQAAAAVGPVPAIPWAWAIGLAFAIYVAAPVSGGHVNPAITLALAVWHGFPWRKVPGYLTAQVAGAVAGALVCRLLGAELLGGAAPAGAAFVAVPVKVSDLVALLFGIVGTAVLLFGVGAVLGAGETAPPRRLRPVVIGVLAGVIGMACGPNTALNPATDIGPRLVAYWSGFGPAFLAPDGHAFWWVPLVGPLLGGVIGAGAFAALVALTGWAAEVVDPPTGPQPIPAPDLVAAASPPVTSGPDGTGPHGTEPDAPTSITGPFASRPAAPVLAATGPVPPGTREPWPGRPTWGPPPPGWTVQHPVPGPENREPAMAGPRVASERGPDDPR